MDTITPMKPVEFMNLMTTATQWGTYGVIRSAFIETFSDKFIEIFTRNALELPSDPSTCLAIQQMHGKAAQPNPGSCFLRREPHFLLEMIATSQNENEASACTSWQNKCYDDLKASGVVLPGNYISLTPPGIITVQELYGSNYEKLLRLKKMYDPHNVFKNAYPRFEY